MGHFHLCFVLITTITAISSQDLPRLEIQPNQKVISKEIGASFALTCRPHVEDLSLVRDLEWRDPRNRKIGSLNRASPIFIQELPGEKATVLVFQKLTDNQSGNYSCHASYASSTQLVETVQIDTYMDITFEDAPNNQYAVLGKEFVVKCKVRGSPAPLIDWNKDGQSITSNEKYVISPTHELIIKNVTESDDGEYTCMAVVLSTGQIKSRIIKVEVQVPPKLLPMEPIIIIEGETASAKCSATGKPPPTYKWIKLSDRQDLSESDRFKVKKNTGELIMTRIEFRDDGEYKCIAANSVGQVETTVKINVLVKPDIYELLNITAPINTDTKIICKARGKPPPRIVFRKLSSREPFRVGQQLDDERIELKQEFFAENNEAFATLSILNLRRSDDGLYECIAENTAGQAYKNGHIAVQFPPTFNRTKNLPPVWSWDGKPGNLTCLPEAIPNATIIWKYGDIEIKNNSNFQIIGNGPVSFLVVRPGNERRFFVPYECIATNYLGKASHKIELKHAEVPRALEQVRAESVTATSIKWSIIPASHFDGLPIKSYTVQYRPEKQISWDYAYNHTWSYGAPYILENLIPEETYHFRFAAKNEVGMGMFTNAESHTMPRRSEPAEPRIIRYSPNTNSDNASDREDAVLGSPYADHFELEWSVPNDNGAPIEEYLIRYCVSERINGNWRDKDCSEQLKQSVQYTKYQLNFLQPDTVYKIELRARNAIGDSSPAQIRMKTARGIDPVVPIQGPSMSSSAIIGIVIAAILLVLVVLDITCYCVNRLGVIALCCNSKSKRNDEEDPKLGREEREPLKTEEKQLSVEFDGKHVYSKSGEIIGKHSAV